MPNYNLKRHGRKLIKDSQLVADVFLLQNTVNDDSDSMTWEKVGVDDDATNYSSTTNPSIDEVRFIGHRGRNRVRATGSGQGNNVSTTGVVYNSTDKNWSFSEPGIYDVCFNLNFSCTASDDDYCDVTIQLSGTDASGTAFSGRNMQIYYCHVSDEGWQVHGALQSYVGILNSTYKINIAFGVGSGAFDSTNRIYGSTAYDNETWCSFMKIGEV